jgi:hypothetical protein
MVGVSTRPYAGKNFLISPILLTPDLYSLVPLFFELINGVIFRAELNFFVCESKFIILE